MYYFCCAGCKTKFSQNPEEYLEVEAPSGEALDPVCNMIVDIPTAKYMSEFEGELVYFCSAGCKQAFDQHPEKYLKERSSGGN